MKGMENEILQSITVDWLSLYCHGSIHDSEGFVFLKLPYSTRHFASVFEIYYKMKKIGTATAHPSSPILHPQSVIVKFENELLYSRSARYFIQKFLIATKLHYVSISRADIARDFHRFLNNLRPMDLITSFFSGKYLKNGRGTFNTYGEQRKKTVYDYLRFGSKSTGRTIYMYNKSKEMAEVREKSYIRAFWEKNGLNTGAEVWRIEFSFKGSCTKTLDFVTGLISKIHWRDLFKVDKLTSLLDAAIKQYFSFKINDNSKNKTRMEDLKLFASSDVGIKLASIPEQSDSITPIKIMLKNMVKEYNKLKPEQKKESFSLHYSITSIAAQYSLIGYLNKTVQFVFSTPENPFLPPVPTFQPKLF